MRTSLALAAESLAFPVAALHILDDVEQRTIASVGAASGVSTPRYDTFCDRVVRSGEPVAIANIEAQQHSAARALREEGMRAYVGMPLIGREGLPVGTVCMLDVQPHSVDGPGMRRLAQFAAVIEEQLDLLRRQVPSRASGDARELAIAIEAGQIVPWFQPIMDLQTERVIAVEALARWEHPRRGLLPPSEFVPLAEDSELIIDLDISVLRQAARMARIWRQFDPQMLINVNISGRHFGHRQFIDRVREAVASADLAPEAVVLELTETSYVASNDTNVTMLAQLRELGFQVLLDDFSNGHSSLDQLLHLPCDGVKIDRATTAALRTPSGDAVVRAVVGLATELGKIVVIEGVEYRDQADCARELGCTHGQGYFWSTPLHANAVFR